MLPAESEVGAGQAEETVPDVVKLASAEYGEQSDFTCHTYVAAPDRLLMLIEVLFVVPAVVQVDELDGLY
jgi:hypothetical protein